MNKEQTASPVWSFPFCPVPPQWEMDWDSIQAQFTWIRKMDGIPQNPIYHAEGDVLVHTRMVVEALVSLQKWRDLPSQERAILFAAALLHDVGKPVCTRVEGDGHITSRGHARRGEYIARQMLWTGAELAAPSPFVCREQIARLVRFHGLPLQFLDHTQPERAILAASQSVRMDHVALLAEADVMGRRCSDAQELFERIALFREFCQEYQCYNSPYNFPNDYSRFMYFQNERRDPHYEAYDDTTFEVVLMSGLPGVGKDTWICHHLADRPVVSLDAVRKELKISPEDDQNIVVQTAREYARELMRKQQSFIWNATNLTKIRRQQLINLFVAYGGSVRIIYLDAAFEIIRKRNQDRPERVPDHVIDRMLGMLEVPDLTEAHRVEWVDH